MRYVILGGHGMLGHDLRARPRGAGCRRPRPRRTRCHRCRGGSGCRRRRRRRDQRGRLHPGRRCRVRRSERLTPSTPSARQCRGRRRPPPGPRSCRSRPTTCSAAPVTEPYAEDTPLRSDRRLRPHEGGRASDSCARHTRHPSSCAPPGCTAQHGASFPRTMLRLAENRETVDVVDRSGRPADLDPRPRPRDRRAARLRRDARHLSTAPTAGAASWFDFARAVFATRRTRPRARAADRQRVVRATRAATGLLGARPRGVGAGRSLGATTVAGRARGRASPKER